MTYATFAFIERDILVLPELVSLVFIEHVR